MPTYEYECTKCSKRFELFQSIKARPKRTLATDCKQCKGKAPVVRCIGTGGGLIFKGSGFYITDYRSESYKQAARGDGSAEKTNAAKPDGTAAADASKSDASPSERKSTGASTGNASASKLKPTSDSHASRKGASSRSGGERKSRKRGD